MANKLFIECDIRINLQHKPTMGKSLTYYKSNCYSYTVFLKIKLYIFAADFHSFVQNNLYFISQKMSGI